MIGESFDAAWQTFKSDYGNWIGFFLVFMVLATLAGSVVPVAGGLIMLPLAIRETNAAVREGRSPVISELWNVKHLGTDVVTMLLYGGAQLVGLMMCFLGWPVAWLGFWYSAELAADGRVSAVDAMKLSWMWATRNLGDTIAMAFISVVLNGAGASLGLGVGLLVTGPVVFLAWAIYWVKVRDQVYALAEERGVSAAPGYALASGAAE